MWLPPLSCDARYHIFGPSALFPYAENRTFTPPDVSKEDLRRRILVDNPASVFGF